MTNLAEVLGDAERSELHRRNLISIIEERGGLDALGNDGVLKGVLLFWDDVSTFHGRPSNFPCYRSATTISNPSFPPSAKLIATLSQGFQRLEHENPMPRDVIALLVRLSQQHK